MEDTQFEVRVQDLINEFGAEIGSLHASRIVDRKMVEAERAAWQQERESYISAIADLTQRLERLEEKDEPSDEPVVLTPIAVKPPKKVAGQ